MNRNILTAEVQEFINRNLREDVTRILLKKSPFKDVSAKELAGQIESKVKCEKKLPTWFRSAGIYYPQKISIEQASSEQTAEYKASLIKGDNVADLTGGFGVDSYFFSRQASRVTHCEHNAELSEIAAYNAEALGSSNIRFINGDGISFLKETDEEFETVYIDPSRRVNAQKVFKLADCEPDVISNLQLLTSKASRVMIKTSPLLDIQAGLSELKAVNEVHVISVKNDCKELLWILDRDIPSEDLHITCTALEPFRQYTFSISDEQNFNVKSFSEPRTFIYEPDVALLKAGCFKLICRDFGVMKLHTNTHLYTSDSLNSSFIGRTFRLKGKWSYRQFLSTIPVQQANIICRNFPLSAEEVKRKSKLKDGGSEYLLFTTGPADELMVLNCERLQ